jgi:phage-related protein
VKTASLARAPPAHDSKGGGASRAPFFSARIQAKATEEDVQARLRVGRPNDRFELEADRVADRVVDGKAAEPGLAAGITPLAQRSEDTSAVPEPEEEAAGGAGESVQAKAATEPEPEPEEDKTLQAKSADPGPAALEEKKEDLQTKALAPAPAAPEEKKEELQTKALAPAAAKEEELPAQARAAEGAAPDREKEGEIQPRARRGGPRSASEAVSRQVRASRGLGSALPEGVRDRMEGAFKADFSGVRIHTDSVAVLLAKELNAQAFTVGGDVFFGEGKFAPGSREGEHLLAHELAHTVQQGAVTPDSAAPAPDVIRLAPDEQAEDGQVRPELHEAIRLARGEIGKVNAKTAGGDGKRVGWERLRDYFNTAFGGPVVSEKVIDRVTMIEKTGSDGKKSRMDALPSWCGIFAWWAMKKAGIPIPDWKLGVSALDAMTLRKGGELPHKGDVAIDVLPNNHFALVTGLESSKDADGNPVKLTRVATVNGNTAGEDNLGGQVQERWDAPARWDHFLDPVGKIAMPPAPPGAAGKAPEGEEPAGPGGEEEAPIGREAAGAEAGEVEAGEPEEAPAPPELETFDSPYPEADLTLPPRPDGGPAEEVAAIETVDMSGSSDQATTAFIDASPSAKAVSQPGFGQAVDSNMKAEQQALADNPPVIEAKTSGAADAPLQSADEIPIPAGADIGDGVTGADPGAIDPVSAPTPEPFRGNAERAKALDEEDSGSFWDAFTGFLRKFVTGIRTSDDSVDTSAGARPGVALEGEADTSRMASQREEGTTALKTQRDAQVEAFRNNPGQSNIRPVKVDESRPVEVSTEATVAIEPQADPGVQEYAAAPLPENVRSAADAKIAAKMEPKLAESRTQTVDAATARDAEQQREIDATQKEARQISADADTDQRKIVVDNRGKVAAMQGEGIGGAYEQVNAFAKDAAGEQVTHRKEIGDHVKTEEGKAKDSLDQGEKDAQKKKEEGEREAAEKKKKLEEEQEKGSWWDRVKSAIKKAVKVITDAIDAVFTAVRSAVKFIIDKVKNFAIGLINAARKWVVDKINKFRDWAKDQVNKYLKDAFPELARRINAGIDSVADSAIAGVNAVADAAIAGVNRLANALAAALDKILSTFQVLLKTAVRVVGAVMQGDFAEALRAAIEGACEIAGVDPKTVFDFLDRAGKAISSILNDPVKFIKGLFGAIGDGIGNFFGNIKTHLIDGVVRWLTGALGEVHLTGPFEFSAKGILRLVLEILGLTYANIKARVIKKLPGAAKVFDVIEGSFDLVKKLLTEGPGALWEEIKSRLSDLKETVMGAIRNWLITTVVKQGIIWLLSLTNPASAIVKAVLLLYDLIMWLVDNYQRIKDFILTVYDGVVAAAAGNFTKVTKTVEDSLVRILPVLISLIASVLSLGSIAKKVKDVIKTITKPINKAIDWVIDRIVKFAKKIITKVKGGAKKVKEKAKEIANKVLNWWKAKSGFSDPSGHPHTLSYKGGKTAATLYVASSNPTGIVPFLNDRMTKAKAGGTKYTVADVKAAQDYHKANIVPAEKKLAAADAGGSAAKKAKAIDANEALANDLQKHLDHLGKTWLAKFFDAADDTDFPPPRLPVMADNVKARNCDADYIVRASKYKHKVKTGTESGQHVGNIHGWAELQGAKLTSGSAKYVRMHLLPHKLGGDAVDSNLTPARGDLFNTPFSAAVEQPAIKSSTEGDEPKRKPIWYKFEIGYHPASSTPPAAWTPGVPYPADAFPNRIHAEWGFYKARDSATTALARDAKTEGKTETPALPDLAVTPPAINKDGPTALLFALQKQEPTITSYFVTELLIGNRRYNSKTEMKDTLWLKFGAEREASRRTFVKATYAAVGTHVTMD